jgi:putative RecB family exonuclease
MVDHRSVSQLKLYERCPHAYRLSKIDKVWKRPAAWLAQGSAVHEAGEVWEKSGRTLTLEEAQDVFRESYARHVNEACVETPDFTQWFASGPYHGQLDIERRFDIGLDQVAKLLAWYDSHPQEVIWIAPDGTPGIELDFDIDLDGVLVRGYIDAIIKDAGELVVRDLKTGNHPGDDFQLAVYAVAVGVKYGIDPPLVGDYWMGKSGKATELFDLSLWTRERVSERFRWLEDNIQAGNFEADPEPSKCRFCDVSWACDYAV